MPELAAFVDGDGQALLRFAYLLTGNGADAEDLVRSVLLQPADRGLQALDDPAAYARRSVVIKHLGLGRRSAAHLRALTRIGRATTEQPEDGSNGEERDALWRALEALAPRQRAAVVLRYYADYQDREIAEVLGCAEGTVRSLVSRALPKVREEMPDPPDPAAVHRRPETGGAAMPEHEARERASVEDRLRQAMRTAADDAPDFRGPDDTIGLGSSTRGPENLLDTVAFGPRRPPGRRVSAAVAGVGVAAAAIAVGAWWFGRDSATPPEASCAAALSFAGRDYVGVGQISLVPAPAQALGDGVLPGCDDGNGAAADERTHVSSIAGVDPSAAVIAGGRVWVAKDASTLPRAVHEARRPVPCQLNGPATLAGTWVSATSDRQPRFDGDLRPPYTIGFSTSAPAVVHDGWQSVLLRVRVTRKTHAPSANDVKAMLQHGKEASLTMHCSGSHFVVDALERG